MAASAVGAENLNFQFLYSQWLKQKEIDRAVSEYSL
jgi:hypothetical protein